MIERRLKILILIFLWVTLLEDIILFLLAWVTPELWFKAFHNTVPLGLENALIRRGAGQWAGFALVQGITLWRWRKEPVWLAVTAGARFTDLFTDISYIVAASSLTMTGWIMLTPLAVLNLIGVVILMRGYKQAQKHQVAAEVPVHADQA
jgi:hypothetical protein